MRVYPDDDAVLAELKAGQGVLVYTELVADLDTPVSAMMKLGPEQQYQCLLESVEGGNTRGRFSVIALAPDLIWTTKDKKITITDGAGHVISEKSGDVLASLREMIATTTLHIPDHLPPMSAGLFGYFGYELISQMERIPVSNPSDLGIADSCLTRPSIVIIFDSLKDQMTIATPARPKIDDHPATVLKDAKARLGVVVEKLNAPLPQQEPTRAEKKLPEAQSSMSKSGFMDAVKHAIEYIKAGDIFQVVLSQRFSVPFTNTPFSLYRTLRRLNPSPFLIYFTMGDFALVGSSPEILVRLRDKKITIRPIAGTRPRGQTPAEDAALAEELLADVKERAEHLMLLDLGRNDTGRVAQPNTVRLVDHFAIERYSHVMHIASEVEGVIRDDCDAIDALKAGFPAGTVSGAPKIRAMEIIDELEPLQRGPYAGAIGYISAAGDMDTCIALRTAVVKDGVMHIQAGAGIVYDSDPEKEYEESINKAKALIRAATEAAQMPS